jgi:hypothetical protein
MKKIQVTSIADEIAALPEKYSVKTLNQERATIRRELSRLSKERQKCAIAAQSLAGLMGTTEALAEVTAKREKVLKKENAVKAELRKTGAEAIKEFAEFSGKAATIVLQLHATCEAMSKALVEGDYNVELTQAAAILKSTGKSLSAVWFRLSDQSKKPLR